MHAGVDIWGVSLEGKGKDSTSSTPDTRRHDRKGEDHLVHPQNSHIFMSLLFPPLPPLLPSGASHNSPRLRKSLTVKESKSKRRSAGTDKTQPQTPLTPDSSTSQEFPPEDVNVLRSGGVEQGVSTHARVVCVEGRG